MPPSPPDCPSCGLAYAITPAEDGYSTVNIGSLEIFLRDSDGHSYLGVEHTCTRCGHVWQVARKLERQ